MLEKMLEKSISLSEQIWKLKKNIANRSNGAFIYSFHLNIRPPDRGSPKFDFAPHAVRHETDSERDSANFEDGEKSKIKKIRGEPKLPVHWQQQQQQRQRF